MKRSPSTVSRELARNGAAADGAGRYRKYAPYAAQARSVVQGRRPKACKLDRVELAEEVQAKLCLKWSPEQISLHLAAEFRGREQMHVSHEAIYQALFVQWSGHLRADLHQHLRTGGAARRPQKSTGRRATKIPDMILISERPAEADDR